MSALPFTPPVNPLLSVPLEKVQQTCIDAGMPPDIWDQLDHDSARYILLTPRLMVRMDSFMQAGPPSVVMQTQFHPVVMDRFNQQFQHLVHAFYYFPNDPEVEPFVVDNADKYILHLNHSLSIEFEDVRNYSTTRKGVRGRKPGATQDPAEKERKTSSYKQWLEDCAEHRARISEARTRYQDAFKVAETYRLELREMEALGAPKRPL